MFGRAVVPNLFYFTSSMPRRRSKKAPRTDGLQTDGFMMIGLFSHRLRAVFGGSFIFLPIIQFGDLGLPLCLASMVFVSLGFSVKSLIQQDSVGGQKSVKSTRTSTSKLQQKSISKKKHIKQIKQSTSKPSA